MGESEIQRDLGGLEADMKALKEQVKIMSEKIDRLTVCMATAKGGYKTLLGVGAVAGAIGGFIVKALPALGLK